MFTPVKSELEVPQSRLPGLKITIILIEASLGVWGGSWLDGGTIMNCIDRGCMSVN